MCPERLLARPVYPKWQAPGFIERLCLKKWGEEQWKETSGLYTMSECTGGTHTLVHTQAQR